MHRPSGCPCRGVCPRGRALVLRCRRSRRQRGPSSNGAPLTWRSAWRRPVPTTSLREQRRRARARSDCPRSRTYPGATTAMRGEPSFLSAAVESVRARVRSSSRMRHHVCRRCAIVRDGRPDAGDPWARVLRTRPQASSGGGTCSTSHGTRSDGVPTRQCGVGPRRGGRRGVAYRRCTSEACDRADGCGCAEHRHRRPFGR